MKIKEWIEIKQKKKEKEEQIALAKLEKKKKADAKEKRLCKQQGISSLAESKTHYRRGDVIKRYKKSSPEKNRIKARERVRANKRPSNLSPDMSICLYNMTYEKTATGRVKRKQGPISKVWSEKKAKDLIYKFTHQFEIKNSKIGFFTIDGEYRIATKASEIVPFIENRTIDPSKGFYFCQYYHKVISRTNQQFFNRSDSNLFLLVQDFMIKKNCCAKFTTKDTKEKVTVLTIKDLKLYRDNIDFDRHVTLISIKPQGRDSDRWNTTYGGRWVNPIHLVSEEQVKEYEEEFYLKRPLRNATIVKTMIDGMAYKDGEEGLLKAKKIYNIFDYGASEKALKNATLFKLIQKVTPRLIPEDALENIENFHSFIWCIIYQARIQRYEIDNFLRGLTIKWANVLGLKPPIKARQKTIEEWLELKESDTRISRYYDGKAHDLDYYGSIEYLQDHLKELKSNPSYYAKFVSDERIWNYMYKPKTAQDQAVNEKFYTNKTTHSIYDRYKVLKGQKLPKPTINAMDALEAKYKREEEFYMRKAAMYESGIINKRYWREAELY